MEGERKERKYEREIGENQLTKLMQRVGQRERGEGEGEGERNERKYDSDIGENQLTKLLQRGQREGERWRDIERREIGREKE